MEHVGACSATELVYWPQPSKHGGTEEATHHPGPLQPSSPNKHGGTEEATHHPGPLQPSSQAKQREALRCVTLLPPKEREQLLDW